MGIYRSWQKAAGRLKREVLTLLLASRHPKTPRLAKVAAALVVAYALSPIDLIPDFIPILGYVDDLILVPLGLYLVVRLIPDEILAECRAEAGQALAPDRRLTVAITALVILTWLGAGLAGAVLIRRMVGGR